MLNFNDLIDRAYESAYESAYGNAYESAYDLSLKKQFSLAKIHTAKGDLKKRWYVYFSFRDPKTGYLEMQTPFYGNANRYKTKEERMAVLSSYCRIINQLLKEGYDPYQDNTEKYYESVQTSANSEAIPKIEQSIPEPQKQQEIPKETISLKEEKPEEPKDMGMAFSEAIDFDLKIKNKLLRQSSMRSYKSHLNVFRKFVLEKFPKVEYIKQLDKSTVMEFLNEILEKTSARNHNNYRASLSSLMTTLEDNDKIPFNFVRNVKKHRADPKRNKSFEKDKLQEIFDYLTENDPLLLLFIQFVSYNFLRPIEVCRLTVGDLDFKAKTITYLEKSKPMKVRLIPEIMMEKIPDLSHCKSTDFLFTTKGLGGEWNTTEDSKRNYFSKRFKNVVKDNLGLNEDYGLYSFRHTFITKLYREKTKTMSDHQAKSEMLPITGHTSIRALENYLRKVDAHMPKDYSEHLRD